MTNTDGEKHHCPSPTPGSQGVSHDSLRGKLRVINKSLAQNKLVLKIQRKEERGEGGRDWGREEESYQTATPLSEGKT